MKAVIHARSGSLHFEFQLEQDDAKEYQHSSGRSIGLAKTHCQVALPIEARLEDFHPDILALSATLMVFPHIGRRLLLPFPVSSDFANVFREQTEMEIGPVSDALSPRKAPTNGIPALAYSGGIDSTAALELMPEETILVFLDRDQSADSNYVYDKEAAIHACTELASMGREVYMISTDLEYLRKPKGFPVDVANAVPALLLADSHGIDSIAFGTVMESAYRVGHTHYLDYVQREHYLRWGGLFAACGVPFNLVTAGVTEVGTAIIAAASKYGGLAQSCTRGKAAAPCNNCWKCFRKSLLKSVLEGEELDHDTLDRMFAIKEAGRFLCQEPIKHENVLAYAVSRCASEHELLARARKRFEGSWQTTEWMEKWYPPSRDVIVEKYRVAAEAAIRSHLGVMSEAEQLEVEAMDRTEYLSSPGRVEATREFVESLHTLAKRVNPAWHQRLLSRLTRWLG